MISTNNNSFYKKFRSFRNLSFGKINRFNHDDISWNYRFTNMQASLGLSQLKRIKTIVKKKRQIGKFYYEKLKNNKNITIQPLNNNFAQNIYWVFGILLKKNSDTFRKHVQSELLKKGVETRRFFWPMHKQKIFL